MTDTTPASTTPVHSMPARATPVRMTQLGTTGGRPEARTERPPEQATTLPLLHIDWVRCDGRGLCTELLPELLDRDEWGYPVARGALGSARSNVPVPRELAAAAADAVALCPRQALRLLGDARG